MRLSPALVAVIIVALATACLGGGDDANLSTSAYDADQVIAIVQGWPLLHQDDYACGAATIPERTIISVVARREFLDFEAACAPSADGSEVTRAVRLAVSSSAWSALPGDGGNWTVSLDTGTARTYEWTFVEDGPQLLASGDSALLWPLFNWASTGQQ